MPFRHYRLLHFTLKRNLSEVYLTIFLKTFALSLVGLFVPIYLLREVGISFPEFIIYLIIAFIFVLIGYLVGAVIGSYIGIRKLIAVSVPFYIVFYFLLYNLQNFSIPINFLAIIIGLGDGIFWLAYNIDFAKFSDKKHRGEEVKFWFVFASLLGILGPFIGGFILSYLNFDILFLLVIVLISLSAVPLLNSKDVVIKYRFSLKDIFRKENFDNAHRFTVQGIRLLVNGIFWPIFVFYIIPKYYITGIVFASAAFFSSIAVWFIGNEVDKLNRNLFSDFSSMINGIVSFIKVFVNSLPQVLGVSVLDGVSYSASEISNNALAYDQANKTNMVGFFIFREIILFLSRITILLILLISNLDLISSLKLGFILMGAVGFLQWLL